MTSAAIEEKARALYDACPTVKPAWHQLGDVTRSVWIERAGTTGTNAPLVPLVPCADDADEDLW